MPGQSLPRWGIVALGIQPWSSGEQRVRQQNHYRGGCGQSGETGDAAMQHVGDEGDELLHRSEQPELPGTGLRRLMGITGPEPEPPPAPTWLVSVDSRVWRGCVGMRSRAAASSIPSARLHTRPDQENLTRRTKERWL